MSTFLVDRIICMDMIDIITHSINNDYDICSVALNSAVASDPKKAKELRYQSLLLLLLSSS